MLSFWNYPKDHIDASCFWSNASFENLQFANRELQIANSRMLLISVRFYGVV